MMIMLLLCLVSFSTLSAGNVGSMHEAYDRGENLLYFRIVRGDFTDATLRKLLEKSKKRPFQSNGGEKEWIREYSFNDPTKKTVDGRTLLHVSAEHERDMCVEVLIEYGVNVDDQDVDGNTPLHIAYKHNKMNVVSVLLTCGADDTLTNNAGQLPSDLE